MERQDQEVYFDQYCESCLYKDRPEKCDPCNECLDYGFNDQSHKPMNWEEKKRAISTTII